MFKTLNNIDGILKIRGENIASKRRIVKEFNGDLFYVFGYKLEDKPWLSYGEKYDCK